jgi:hypothetical protein
MARETTGGEVSLPHEAVGILAAAVTGLLARYFLLQPLLGQTDGKAASMVLMWFLLGYLALPVASLGQSPLPWSSWRRLRSGLLFSGIVTLTIVVPDRLWP